MKNFIVSITFLLAFAFSAIGQLRVQVVNDSTVWVRGVDSLNQAPHPYYEWNGAPISVASRNTSSDVAISYRVHRLRKVNDSTASVEVAGLFQPGETVQVSFRGLTGSDVHDASAWPADQVYRVPRGTSLSAITNLSANFKYVLFEKGQTYTGQFYAKSGVYYGNYGSGTLPVLDGRGANATVWIENQSKVTMRGLEIRNTNTNFGYQGVRGRNSSNLRFCNIVVPAATNGIYLQGVTRGGYVIKGCKFDGCYNAGVYLEGAPTRAQGAGNGIIAWNDFGKTTTNDPLVLHPIADAYGDLGDNWKIYANRLREGTAEELLDVVGGHFVYVDSNLFHRGLRPLTIGWNATDVWVRGNWFDNLGFAANSCVSIRSKGVTVEGNWIVGTYDNQYAGNNRSAFFLYGRERGEKAEDVVIRNNIVHLLDNGKALQPSRSPQAMQMYSQSMLPVYGNVTFSNNFVLYDVNGLGVIEFENTGIYPIGSSKYTAGNNRYYLRNSANLYEEGSVQRNLAYVQGLGKEAGSQVLAPSAFPYADRNGLGPRIYTAMEDKWVVLGTGSTPITPLPPIEPSPTPGTGCQDSILRVQADQLKETIRILKVDLNAANAALAQKTQELEALHKVNQSLISDATNCIGKLNSAEEALVLLRVKYARDTAMYQEQIAKLTAQVASMTIQVSQCQAYGIDWVLMKLRAVLEEQ